MEAINELMKPENVRKNGRGGSFGGGKRTDVWYSWVDNPPNNRYETLDKAFEGWGFAYSTTKDGSVVIDCIENEKLGQEELFFGAIAPYVTSNSEVVIHGEDGAHFRWVFKNKKLVEQAGRLTFR